MAHGAPLLVARDHADGPANPLQKRKRARVTQTDIYTETTTVVATRTVDGEPVTQTRTALTTMTGSPPPATPSNIQTVYIQQVTIGAATTANASSVSGSVSASVSASASSSASSAPATFISVALLSSAMTVPSSIALLNGNAAPATGSTDGTSLSGGAIAGIAIASLLGLLGLIALILWFMARRRDERARAYASDMMAPSALPDPYSSNMLSRETPGSFVRFHDDDSYGDLGAGAVGAAAAGGRGRRPISGYSRGSRGSAMMGDDDGDAYDDLSQEDEYERRGARNRY